MRSTLSQFQLSTLNGCSWGTSRTKLSNGTVKLARYPTLRNCLLTLTSAFSWALSFVDAWQGTETLSVFKARNRRVTRARFRFKREQVLTRLSFELSNHYLLRKAFLYSGNRHTSYQLSKLNLSKVNNVMVTENRWKLKTTEVVTKSGRWQDPAHWQPFFIDRPERRITSMTNKSGSAQ